jgi:hypothetical protein
LINKTVNNNLMYKIINITNNNKILIKILIKIFIKIISFSHLNNIINNKTFKIKIITIIKIIIKVKIINKIYII